MSEAEILNVALFGKTSKEFKEENPLLAGNLRDNANIVQLVCLSNLESINSVFIKEGLNSSQRIIKLNKIAIEQMNILVNNSNIKILENKFNR